jgi:hypothetical protein
MIKVGIINIKALKRVLESPNTDINELESIYSLKKLSILFVLVTKYILRRAITR